MKVRNIFNKMFLKPEKIIVYVGGKTYVDGKVLDAWILDLMTRNLVINKSINNIEVHYES